MNKLECKSWFSLESPQSFPSLCSHSLSLSHYQTGGYVGVCWQKSAETCERWKCRERAEGISKRYDDRQLCNDYFSKLGILFLASGSVECGCRYSHLPPVSSVYRRKELSKPVDCKGDQSWVFFGRNDAKAETPVLWPPHAKNWLIGKDWCWEGLGAGGTGDNRGWDGWMASPTRWTWVWVNSGSWWWTGRPDVLQLMGSQRVGHDWATSLSFSLSFCVSSFGWKLNTPRNSELSFMCLTVTFPKKVFSSSEKFRLWVWVSLNICLHSYNTTYW